MDAAVEVPAEEIAPTGGELPPECCGLGSSGHQVRRHYDVGGPRHHRRSGRGLATGRKFQCHDRRQRARHALCLLCRGRLCYAERLEMRRSAEDGKRRKCRSVAQYHIPDC
ncbi:uncharacterized protein LOC120424702 [Culex pipiens pallens]|uniref:uncharacterized protein LOC120424702 n=1 Tax=Culex pipiens pallens TaxID=42434 RepID=UPI001952A3BB|nr:uncharacterized protein LOC120424702 [Culex pipiens pallens]